MLQTLKERYDRYIQEAQTVRNNASALDGYLGFGADPRKDPCHMAFYRDVEQWVKDFSQAEHDSLESFAAVEFMLTAPIFRRNTDSFWFLYAAHGLCRELIPELNKDQCAELVQLYDREFPRRDRMAAQDGVYKALTRGARGK